MPEESRRLEADTLDLIFELSRPAPEKQLRDAEALDGKILQVFSAGSVLIGLASLRGGHRQTFAGVLIVVAVAAFLVVAAYALRALWSRTFRVLIEPPQLWDDYWADSPESIKHAVVADLASGYAENSRLLKTKRSALGRTLLAAGVEAVAVGVALAASTL